MAGVPAGLPAGVRVSDHISLGVIAKTFPPGRVQRNCSPPLPEVKFCLFSVG